MKSVLTKTAVVPLALTALLMSGCAVQGNSQQEHDGPHPSETLAAFVEDVKADTRDYVSKVSTAPNEEAKKEIHAQEFADSYEHLDSNSLNDEQKLAIVDQFSMLYLVYPQATVTVDEDGFVITGTEATLRGSAINLEVDGQKQEVNDSTTLTMKKTASGWKLSGLEGDDK